MRINPMTPEQHERQLAYSREYARNKRKAAAEERQAKKVKSLENRTKIAAAILAYEMLQKQEVNG